MPEDIQENGREGAATLKRRLEATTFMELPFDAELKKLGLDNGAVTRRRARVSTATAAKPGAE